MAKQDNQCIKSIVIMSLYLADLHVITSNVKYFTTVKFIKRTRKKIKDLGLQKRRISVIECYFQACEAKMYNYNTMYCKLQLCHFTLQPSIYLKLQIIFTLLVKTIYFIQLRQLIKFLEYFFKGINCNLNKNEAKINL